MIDETIASESSAPDLHVVRRQSRLRAGFGSIAKAPWFAYLTIFALQLRTIWNIWQVRDLTSGDTSGYFARGWIWFTEHKISLVWSPLYDMFYGSLLALSRDAYTITILHRMVIVLASTILILAVMRRLFPPGIAWLIAAWWAMLPVNFDAMYEVHQFTTVPILLIWLLALRPDPGPWTRGICLTLFLGTTFLVRNEMIVATGCFGLVCIYQEYRRRSRQADSFRVIPTVAAYLLPLATLAILLVWFAAHSDSNRAELRDQMRIKHTLNMAQVYAFGYQQRHPEWNKSPWTDCEALCRQEFGDPLPTLGLMIRRNPRAVLDHVLWNLRLVPSGIQLLLFNNASGRFNPDYGPANLGKPIALKLSLVLFAIVAIGIAVGWKHRQMWRSWAIEHQLGLLAMLSVVAVAPAIIATQRPRPEYLFVLSIFLMAVVGAAIWSIARQWRLGKIWWAMPALMVAAPLFAHSYYGPPQPRASDSRELLKFYERLNPYERLIDDRDCRLLKQGYAAEIQYYVGHSRGAAIEYAQVLPGWKPGETLSALLDRNKINLLSVDQTGFAAIEQRKSGAFQQFLDEAGKNGWHLIGDRQFTGSWWMLFHRTDDTASATVSIPHDIQFSGWDAVSNILPAEGPYPQMNLPIIRWSLFPSASLKVAAKESGRYRLTLVGYTVANGQIMDISIDGRKVAQHRFSPVGVWDTIELTPVLTAGEHQVTLTFSVTVPNATPETPRLAVLFKRIQFEPAPGATSRP